MSLMMMSNPQVCSSDEFMKFIYDTFTLLTSLLSSSKWCMKPMVMSNVQNSF